MKKLTCEMCGGTDLMKTNGVFVCQSCGCKYSVEEAKKLMVKIGGSVTVKNAPKVKSLLKLAQSSFDSENYAKCEDFCNQIIAMDAQNFEAWKLKGDAICYQLNDDNRREVEAYNCIIVSYNLLDGNKKEENMNDILFSLEECFSQVVWSELFLDFCIINNINDTVNETNKVFNNSYNYVAKLISTSDFNVSENEIINLFKNRFISVTNHMAVSRFNYCKSFIKTDDETRNQKNINDLWRFLEFMQYIEKKFFNSATSDELKREIYQTILYFQTNLKDLVFGKEKQVLKNSINQYQVNYANAIHKIIEEETKDDSIATIISNFKEYITEKDYVEAEVCADIIIERNSDSQIGYLCKALAIYSDDVYAVERDDKIALKYLRKALECSSSGAEKNDIKFIVNNGVGKNKNSLLILATSYFDFEMVEFLVSVGADVNYICNNNTNALWFVCNDEIDDSNLKSGKKIAKLLLDSGSNVNVKSKSGVDLYNKYTNKEIAKMIKEKYPEIEKGSSSGCYVATAVYGSYDCPQVWTLRRYRDYTLAETWYGRAFIRAYYAISPTLVKWFGKTTWFKKMWKGKLDRMVADLQEKGFESTPYDDRIW